MLIAKAVSAVAFGAFAVAGLSVHRTAPPKPASPPVITIIARDYSYDPIPDIPAGVVDLRLHNLGKDIHHAGIFKLLGRHTGAQFLAAMKNPGPLPAWAIPTPGPNAPAPGATSNSIAELTPGSYIVMCFVDTNGGVPHFMKGMTRTFRVVPSSNGGRAPKADLDLSLFDYGFKFKTPVTAGNHVIRLTNAAAQPHEVEIIQLAPGKTAKELHDWLLGPMTTQAPGTPMGGVMNVTPGSHPEFRMTLTPGHYVAFCFLPDAKDGKPHFSHGMEWAFEVK